jgi:hypothetical protein
MRSPVLFGERVSVMTPFLSTTNRACGVFVLSGARAGGRPDCEFWLVFGPAGAGFPPRRAPRANGTAPNLTAIIGGSTRLLLSQLEARELGRVDLGGLPPRPPTDPDVRVKRIWLVTLWRCPSHVHCLAVTRWEVRCPRRDSGIGPTTRRLLCSTGSGRARSPASTLLWGTPTPCRPSRRTSFRLAIPCGVSLVRPQQPRTWLRIILEFLARFLSRHLRWRRQGLPSSRKTRLIIRQCSSDPGETRHAGGSKCR